MGKWSGGEEGLRSASRTRTYNARGLFSLCHRERESAGEKREAAGRREIPAVWFVWSLRLSSQIAPGTFRLRRLLLTFAKVNHVIRLRFALRGQRGEFRNRSALLLARVQVDARC